jgi:hypothetical protein
MSVAKPARKHLVLAIALAAALPLVVGIGLYLRPPGTGSERANARLAPNQTDAGDAGSSPIGPAGAIAAPALEADGAASSAASGCKERLHRVTIDGNAVDAFALLCREEGSPVWTLVAPAGAAPGDDAAELAEPATVEAAATGVATRAVRAPPRRGTGSVRRASRRVDVASSGAAPRGHRTFYVDPRADSRQKFGP